MSSTAKMLESLKASLVAGDIVIGSLVETGSSLSLETPITLNGPLDFEPTNFGPQGVCDLEKFYRVAKEIVAFGQSLGSNDPSKYVELVGEYPDIDFAYLDAETISHKLIRREPAKMDVGGDRRPQRDSLFHREIRSPSFPNKVLYLNTRPLDHIVEFTCYARNASIANKRALWLERLFVNYSWVFKVAGVDRFHFESRGSDNYRSTAGQPIHERSLRFFVRMTEIQIDIEPEIKKIFATGEILKQD